MTVLLTVANCSADSLAASISGWRSTRRRRIIIGETVLLRDGNELIGFAVRHCGTETEVGSGQC